MFWSKKKKAESPAPQPAFENAAPPPPKIFTPDEKLLNAIRDRNPEGIAAALAENADPNANGGAPLRKAAKKESFDMAYQLVVAGADINLAINAAWFDVKYATHYDAGDGYTNIDDSKTYYDNKAAAEWLTKKKGDLLEKFIAEHMTALERDRALLKDEVTALKAALGKFTEPGGPDKPKLNQPEIGGGMRA